MTSEEEASCSKSLSTGTTPIPQSKKTLKQHNDKQETKYHLKWIKWNCGQLPIVMQSMNGPCPLIAIVNVLSLRDILKLPDMLHEITAVQLLTYIGECMMDCIPEDIRNNETALLNYEQNIHDAIEVLPKLLTGLDVNVKFAGVSDFEYTPECIVFDLLRISLYHGWIVDDECVELKEIIGSQSYNQLVDFIVTNKNSENIDAVTRALLVEDFLETTASQLTSSGLSKLKEEIENNEIFILFRNNHFLTVLKRDDELYQLVTDHGFTKERIIWETLNSIDGDGQFLDANFEDIGSSNKQLEEYQSIDKRQQQMENDFLMALSLKQEEDDPEFKKF